MSLPAPSAMRMRLPALGLFFMFAVAPSALAQLIPSRAYFGVGRTIPMTVEVPTGQSGEVEIVLLAPPDAAEVERASAEAGKVDLAGLFPILWSSLEPRVLYAQLEVGGQKIGPAVVLAPMLTPLKVQPLGQRMTFAPNPARLYSGIHAWTDRHIVFDTTAGEIEVRLRPDQAPNTCRVILDLVEGGFYSDIKVHRIVPTNRVGDPFVVQFGDPTGTGGGGPGFYIDLEPSKLPHDFGVLSLARGTEPNTNGSQVFICLSRKGTSFLDGNYTSFAQTVRGAETIVRLERTPLADRQRGVPADPAPVVRGARTTPAPPYGEGPKPVTRPVVEDR